MLRITLSTSRNALLTVLVAALLITAGCNGLGVGETDTGPDGTTSTPESTATPTPTPTPTVPQNGTDLRSISLEQDAGHIINSDLDGGDPKRDGKYYEPVQFAAEAGTVVNISMRSPTGDPLVKLRGPNGTVIDLDDDGGMGDAADLTMVTLPETGQYTIIATSSEPNTAFTYYLTVEQFIPPEQRDVLFAGNMSSWNRTEQLGEFAYDYTTVFNEHTWTNITGYSVNADEEYIAVTYVIEPENRTFEKMAELDGVMLYGYTGVDKSYQNADGVVNPSWAPERIYFRTVTPDGELYRISYLTSEQAQTYRETQNFDRYYANIWRTRHYGPAHFKYVEGADNATSTGEIGNRDKSEEFKIR
ncbi:hypothetical protein [Haloarcula pellucida]|uniref:Pre-peptidase C-terminal domain-containing protein n=1 Tax=Haloarcula pellucida TaxID=1427151 RepID=A0A830GRH2_9EURY|nr:hypothetical protein [Halomicroarcula pellucida]MBX0350184.1 hypothetical protein [Halomicroarcula pellucida]GGO00791.1 hypothetical protein GCM10009030_33830 [Halomicroarcula pellucida]